jgi:hypothetical protein
MLEWTTFIEKYGENGEKTGWHFVTLTQDQALMMKENTKLPFRVKGLLDKVAIKGVSLRPVGEGDLILPINAKLLKQLGKRKGDKLHVSIVHDSDLPPEADELLDCLADEPKALAFFENLSQSHKNYFHGWVLSAKTIDTRTKRLVSIVEACAHARTFPEMIRWMKEQKER